MRFGWGAAGAASIGSDAHLVVWVDVLPTSDVHAAAAAVPDGPEVVLAGIGNAAAVADRALVLQAAREDRCIVAIVAAGIDDTPVGGPALDASLEGAGEPAGDTSTVPDFAVEDLLVAGAVVDALADGGIDFSSPEAAAAGAAFTGLRGALRHLVAASVSAELLDSAGRHDAVEAALTAGASLPVLRPARAQPPRAGCAEREPAARDHPEAVAREQR